MIVIVIWFRRINRRPWFLTSGAPLLRTPRWYLPWLSGTLKNMPWATLKTAGKNWKHLQLHLQLKDPICHSDECQIGSFSSEATICSWGNKCWHINPVMSKYIAQQTLLQATLPKMVIKTRVLSWLRTCGHLEDKKVFWCLFINFRLLWQKRSKCAKALFISYSRIFFFEHASPKLNFVLISRLAGKCSTQNLKSPNKNTDFLWF